MKIFSIVVSALALAPAFSTKTMLPSHLRRLNPSNTGSNQGRPGQEGGNQETFRSLFGRSSLRSLLDSRRLQGRHHSQPQSRAVLERGQGVRRLAERKHRRVELRAAGRQEHRPDTGEDREYFGVTQTRS